MPSVQRFTALDVFRGMTVCFMIIVNTPGNEATTYAPLLHAQWHGFTPTDLVFPSFMFAVGNAMSFTMKKWERQSNNTVVFKILKRTIIIFLIGYLMYWFPFVHRNGEGQLVFNPIGYTRVMGVLQRIALAYGIAALMIRFLKLSSVIRISVVLILLYWLILLMFGIGDDPYDMLMNAGSRIDRFFLGENHLYHGEGVAFDPEGLLSTLPSIANVTFGFAAGKWIQQKSNSYEGLAKLLLAGASLILLALIWNWVFPINKKLWTGSFVFLTVGIDCILIAALIYVIDFLQIKRWTYFFEVFGKNPLFIYLLSELGVTLLWFFDVYQWLYQTIFQPAGNYFGSFLFAVSIMLACWIMGYLLDRNKVYVRV